MNESIVKQPRIYALDGIRGLCALSIMMYHLNYWNGHDYFQVGYFGVYIFFILSGFSLWYVYASKPLTIDLLKHFFVARFARIIPLYLLMVAFGVAARMYAQGLESITSASFISRFLLNISFLFGFSAPGKSAVVPGGWSIGIEWVFYMVFPLFLMFGRNLRHMVVLLIASIAINQAIVAGVLKDGDFVSQLPAYTTFPAFLMYFVGGIIIAMVYKRLHSGYSVVQIKDSWWLSRLIPLFAIAFIFSYPVATPDEYLLGTHVVVLLLTSMVAILFASIAQVRVWEKHLYGFLGDISYSVYLIHFFVFSGWDIVLKHLYPQHSNGFIIGLTASSSIALAYASYRFFESPARSWLNRKMR